MGGGNFNVLPPNSSSTDERLAAEIMGHSVVEIDEQVDTDSTFGDGCSITASLSSSVLDYRYENGRRYHAYKEGKYPLPNDEQEQERLDIMHQMFTLAIGNRLFLAPLDKIPGRILDLGTGTGTWAIGMGDMFPSASVVGNDLSPIQPQFVPPNVSFEVDDVEEDFPFSHPFDYVHARFLAASIRDWPRLLGQVYKCLRPGGWAEFYDCDFQYTSDDGSLTPEHSMSLNIASVIDASQKAGKDACPGPKLKRWMENEGFANVTERKFIFPIGTWPKDRKLKELGAWNQIACEEGVEAWSMALLTREGGFSPERVQAELVQVRKDLRDRSIHAYYVGYVVFGQRPE